MHVDIIVCITNNVYIVYAHYLEHAGHMVFKKGYLFIIKVYRFA